MNPYDIHSLGELLSGNSYPGRGLIAGQSPDGKLAYLAYFIMGRSENSRNRVFVRTPDGIKTQAASPDKMSDPSLIIYTAVRRAGGFLVAANGDQTDTIADFLEKGSDMESALETRCFEPDGPNFTPRISLQLCPNCCDSRFRYKLSILKSANAEGTACTRQYFRYEAVPRLGHYIHTYERDGNPLPSFAGEPERVAVPGNIDALTEEIWGNLNENNKISLYVRAMNLETGEEEDRLVNKYERT